MKDARHYAAINALSTGLSLTDWLYHTIRDHKALVDHARRVLGEFEMKSEQEFSRSLRAKSGLLNTCHQVCNANKHYHLKNLDPQFNILVADIVMERSDGEIDITVVAHVVHDGISSPPSGSIDMLLPELVRWWGETLDAIQIPGKDLYFEELSTVRVAS